MNADHAGIVLLDGFQTSDILVFLGWQVVQVISGVSWHSLTYTTARMLHLTLYPVSQALFLFQVRDLQI